jgi:drug/metabolite transporter (DMT)-like permease
MFELKNPKVAVPVVLFAGLIWSFGPLVVRYMNDPQLIPWQYIFGRGLTIFILLNLYLFFEKLFKNWFIWLNRRVRPWYCNDFFYVFYY